MRQVACLLTLALGTTLGCGTELVVDADTSLCVVADVAVATFADSGPVSADVLGSWAMVQVLTTSLSIAGAQASENRIMTLSLTTIEAADSGFMLAEEVCSITITNIAGVCGEASLVTTEVPEAYVASLSYAARPMSLNESAGALLVEAPRVVRLKGVALDDPIHDALPEDVTDPGYFDQDGDGKPGMTLRFIQPGMVVGELYVGQRDWTEMSGEVLGAGLIQGLVAWGSEQVVLGSNPLSLLQTSPQSAPASDPEKSDFTMVRVGAAMTCGELVAAATTLFPGR